MIRKVESFGYALANQVGYEWQWTILKGTK
jgi:hypothetical protein